MSEDPTEIVVEGYSRRFAAALKKLFHEEGGWSNNPADHGGATNYGISLRFLVAEGAFDSDHDGRADFDLDMDGDIDWRDVKELKRGDAAELYHRCFWQRLDCEQFPAPLGEAMFDQGVNGGIFAAKKMLQRAINQALFDARGRGASPPAQLKVDGSLGEATRSALQWVLRYPSIGMPGLISWYREAVKERYRDIVSRNPSQGRFLNGWLKRAERLGQL